MTYTEIEISKLFKALEFASEKHKNQTRKNVEATPYINHPIEVARLLIDVGNEYELDIVQAAILHDTIEDTETTAVELMENFGETVTGLVVELTDDKSLPKQVRKKRQIEKAPKLSTEAKKIKISDKISNVTDVTYNPPGHWDLKRRQEYLDWAERVVAGLQGVNPKLEELFYQKLKEGRGILNGNFFSNIK
jgi:guanosine-3',5'-bis(diphosphate) 3'-pyrophosphohydrolase